MKGRTAIRRIAVLVGSLVAVGAFAASPAFAGSFTSSATSCSEQSFAREFLPWLDLAEYTVAPDGGLEAGGNGWRLAGGAAVVAGNEGFYIGSKLDRRSLKLPAGSSATTRPMCVGLEHPTLRFFARNTGSPLSLLAVEVLFEDVTGTVRSLQVGAVAAGSHWQPTLPIAFLANATSILSKDGKTAAAFRFTPLGWGGEWQIDDVYVDPFRAR